MTLAKVLTEGAVPLIPFGEEGLPSDVRRRILKVEIPIQRGDNWCWAAVAVGIACAYGDTELTQCKLATKVLSVADPSKQCCPSFTNADCDVEMSLKTALTLPGHEHLDEPILKPQSWEFIKQEIDAGRPIGVCIAGGNAHFLAITGYREDSNGEQYVYYDDPLTSRGVRTLQSFSTRSDGSKWFSTYKTKGKDGRVAEFRIKVPPDPVLTH